MTAVTAIALPTDPAWADIARQAPKMAATMRRYLDQIAVSLRPSSVIVNDNVLRLFAGHIIATDPKIRSVARINRTNIEDYKRALAQRRTRTAQHFHQHHPPTARLLAHVFRADHRVGL